MITLQSIPVPDQFFWYFFGTAMVGIVVYFCIRWINSIDNFIKSSSAKFEALAQGQALHSQIIESRIQLDEKEVTTNIKLAQEMIETLMFLRNSRESDATNPTALRFQKHGKL